MKLRLTFAIACSALAIGATACSSGDASGTGTDDLSKHPTASSGHPVCDPLVCPTDEHWSSTECKCIADCTEMWACTPDEHWDADACKCVPNVVCDPLVCPADDHWSSTECKCVADCTEIWACIKGDHWDADACKCVPDVSTSSK